MSSFAHRCWLYLAVGLLIAQVALLWLSLTALYEISIFCTGARTFLLSTIGSVHVSYIGLLLLGLASLFWPRARAIYVGLICLALLVLPLQAHLVVRNDQLFCDVP